MQIEPLRLLLACSAVVAGCSVVNAFDDVKPEVAAGGSAGSSSGGSAGSAGSMGGSAGSSSGGSAGSSSGGSAGSSSGGSAGTGGSSSGGSAGTGGSAGSAGSGGTPDHGIIVVAGTDGATPPGQTDLLAVLSTVDGSELSRDTESISAVGYDAKRDLWIVLKGDSQTPGFNDKVSLEVREYDIAAKQFSVRGTVADLPAPRSANMSVINGRVAYLGLTASPAGAQVVIVNTDNPDSPALVGMPLQPTFEAAPIGMVGNRAIGNAPGGKLTIGMNVCATDCLLKVLPIQVGSGTTVNVQSVVELATLPLARTPALARHTERTEIAAVLPQQTTTVVRTYGVSTYSFDKEVPLGTTGPAIGQAVYARCENAIVAGSGGKIHATSLTIAQTGERTIGTNASRVTYDPYTATVFVPFVGAGFDFFPQLISDATLTGRNGWTAPSDLSPTRAVVARAPESLSCP